MSTDEERKARHAEGQRIRAENAARRRAMNETTIRRNAALARPILDLAWKIALFRRSVVAEDGISAPLADALTYLVAQQFLADGAQSPEQTEGP